MNTCRIRIVMLSIVALLLAPTFTTACPIAFRRVGPLEVRQTDLTRPVYRLSTRSAWGFDASWTTTRPELNQEVVIRNKAMVVGATHASQRDLSIDAVAPQDLGWLYGDDTDPDTPPCAIAGRSEWEAPVIKVREDSRRVRVAAAARRIDGDRTGCVLGADQGERACPSMTRMVVRLRKPLGSRQLHFELPR